MPPPSLLYRAAALGARAALPLLGWVNTRLGRMQRERKELARLLETAPPRSPTIHFHAASAGELRQLEPVIRRVRIAHPGARLAVTWFSTSGRQVGESLGADITGALPWDSPWEVGTFLDRLSPALIVIGKLDLWPELAWQAERRRIPVALVAATVREESGRLRWPVRGILEPGYAALAAVGAASDEDARRLIQLGVLPQHITVTGDPRYDSVLARLEGTDPVARDPTLLVAGSTWPADELLLLHAFAEVRTQHPAARLLLVPHQPTPAALERIAGLARALGLPAPGTDRSPTSPLVVDLSVGGLALTYRRGAMAYVGGGFNLTGAHSVLEPAAAGAPVIIGPLSPPREARLLEEAGGLVRLGHDAATNELGRSWLGWLNDAAARDRAGAAAKEAADAGRGAAERTLELLKPFLPPRG